jgi:predicted transcriptional regulator
LVDFYYTQINPEKGEVLAEVKKTHVEQLPIPIINNENGELYDAIINLVEQLLKLNDELLMVKIETKKQSVEAKIDYCTNKIDTLTYQLFDLTPEDIEIIENFNP